MTGLRIGIIGFGSIVELAHLPAIRALPGGATVLAVVDESEERRRVARQLLPEVQLVTASLEELIDAKPDLDLVVTALPPRANGPAASLMARIGYQVLAEKPLASGAAAARALFQEEVLVKRVSMVHNYLFRTDVEAALDALRRGLVGTVRLARLERPDPGHFVGSGVEPDWRRSLNHHGGCLRDNAYHLIYLAEALCQSPLSGMVTMLASDEGRAVEDIASVVLRHSNGALTTILTAWCAQASQPVLEVNGQGGTLRLWGDADRCEMNQGSGWMPVPGQVGIASYERMYRHLLNVGIGNDPRLSVYEGIKVLSVIDQLYADSAHAKNDGGE